MKISQREFRRRRRRLMESMAAGSVAVLAAAGTAPRNGDVEYPFRQDSNFYYLCGFDEPDAVLVLRPDADGGQCVLFCRERDIEAERWTGARAGPEGAVRDFQMDSAYALADIDRKLPELLAGCQRVYYPMGGAGAFDLRLQGWLGTLRAAVRSGQCPPGELHDLNLLLHEMRLIKGEAELELMRAAARISCRAHVRAMRNCRPGGRESQLEAELMYEFLHGGSQGWAYPSIVAAGGNACVLHYTANSAPLVDGELVLIDAGCEVDGYAADITRTFPVNGCFSPAQRQLYALCLEAQTAAIGCIKPGVSWQQPHRVTVEIITRGLLALGLLDGDAEQLIEDGAYRRFYMHRAGHWLGLDVHDAGSYRSGGEWRALEPGMVFTVEPGIYVAADDDSVDSRWRGIGIRIEDDVVVTADGCEVLTREAPKSIDEIERVMGAVCTEDGGGARC